MKKLIEENRHGLVGHWKYHGNVSATGTWYDISGNGNNGTLIGNAYVDSNGLNLDGSGDYVNCGEGGGLFETTNFTWICWLKKPIISSDYQCVMKKETAYEGTRHHLHVYSNYRIHNGLGSSYWMIDNASFTANVGSMITWSYNGALSNVYQNNSLLSSVSYTDGVPSTSSNFFIGAADSSHEFLSGLINDVRIYNRSLSAEEISQIYHQTKGRYQ